ncbi:MAG: hypothetical protein WCF97_05385 [Nitrososphaeraceae archaeon]
MTFKILAGCEMACANIVPTTLLSAIANSSNAFSTLHCGQSKVVLEL